MKPVFGLIAMFIVAMPVQSVLASELESHWLQMRYEKSREGGDSSTSRSSGRQALIETVLEEGPERTVLHYDWPRDEDGKAQSNFWYFPATLLEKPDGSHELLKRDEVEGRIEAWLQKYSIPREACGKWTHGNGFPFRVDCDPNDILNEVKPFNLRLGALVAGDEFEHPLAASSGNLMPLPEPRRGLTVTLAIDPEKARDDEARNALILAEMMGENLSEEQARKDAALIDYAGFVTIEIDLDEHGKVEKRTDISKITISRPDRDLETANSLITVERLDNEPDRGALARD